MSFICKFNRLVLAALHYNENADRPCKREADGTIKLQVNFTRAKKGRPSVRKVKEAATYGKS